MYSVLFCAVWSMLCVVYEETVILLSCVAQIQIAIFAKPNSSASLLSKDLAVVAAMWAVSSSHREMLSAETLTLWFLGGTSWSFSGTIVSNQV